ncbi:hypothetical protein BpHYR1_008649 [Brachionus plicatilis]|uniref:Uncharacterized protein n=1 Tax=Brachionus plicatilis TaxID=10195 RepID=A0A3M7T9X5_BRAPC|nr:hypothetical protein BpHYR1_008649 [Brachionus plicatilis]
MKQKVKINQINLDVFLRSKKNIELNSCLNYRIYEEMPSGAAMFFAQNFSLYRMSQNQKSIHINS